MTPHPGEVRSSSAFSNVLYLVFVHIVTWVLVLSSEARSMLTARSTSNLLHRRPNFASLRQSFRKASDSSSTEDSSEVTKQLRPLIRKHSVHPDQSRWADDKIVNGPITRQYSSIDPRSRKSVAPLVNDLTLYDGDEAEESSTKRSQTGEERRGGRYVRKQSQTGNQEGTGTLVRKHAILAPYVDQARITNPEPTGRCIRKVYSDKTESPKSTFAFRYWDTRGKDSYSYVVIDRWINDLSNADIPVDTYEDVSLAERPVSFLLRNILTKSIPTDWTPSLVKHVPNWLFWKSPDWLAATITDLSTDPKVFVQRTLEPPSVYEHPNLGGGEKRRFSAYTANAISPDLPVDFYIHAKPKYQQELYPRQLGYQLYKAFKICPNIIATSADRRTASSQSPTEQDSKQAQSWS